MRQEAGEEAVDSVDNVWMTRTLAQQSKSERKRTKLTEIIEIVQTEQEDNIQQIKSVLQYLACLYSYLLAWGRAGVGPCCGTLPTETRQTDSCDMVLVPLDALMAYHDRAQRKATQMARFWPEATTLNWLVTHDEEERAVGLSSTGMGALPRAA